MGSTDNLSLLTQSKFYSPALNGAIFDGPIRIYFAQTQESMALKIYFSIMSRLKTAGPAVKACLDTLSETIFLIIYPSREGYEVSFPGDGGTRMITDRLGDDHIIGICGPLSENDFDVIYQAVLDILSRFVIPETTV
jgi:hypothetical protein